MVYLVKHNFAVYQPAWRGDYVRRFGPNNEGFEVQAESMEQAKEKLEKEHNLNPFYLSIREIV